MKRIVFIAMLALLLCTAAFAQDGGAKQKAAEESAQSWLALVDGAHYGQSWQEAAAFFQSKISKAGWEKALQQARAPLGAAAGRTLSGATYQTELPNAPKGEYFILQYKTAVAGKAQVIETVVPMLDKDGKWRVSGYFIRPAE